MCFLLLGCTVDPETPELEKAIAPTLYFQKAIEIWTQESGDIKYLFIIYQAILEEVIWSGFQIEGFILLALKCPSGELRWETGGSAD